jgi:4-aminobutyrate aminotransferase-like enzyme/Ser/Thr protein kinase RdoA (MazF antagonist)
MNEPAPAVRVGATDAARLALDLYGLQAQATALAGEYDDNFHLGAGDGRSFVLKLMHPSRERGLVELQVAALGHLAAGAPHLPFSRVVPTFDGRPLGSMRDAGGEERVVWMLTHLPGRVLAEARPRTPELLEGLGRLLGEMDLQLSSFSHPAARRELKWDLAAAGWIRGHLQDVADPARRTLVSRFLALYESHVLPALPSLRRQVIHGDANDYNVIVGDPRQQPRPVSVIDFGDMHEGLVVAEPAVAAAYAILGEGDPIGAAAALVSGYHRAFPLEEREIALLYALIGIRLAVSVTNSAWRRRLVPDDPYVTISEAPAWEALARLAAIPERLAHYRFRDACGLTALPDGPKLASWLATHGPQAAPVLAHDLRTAPSLVFDFGVSGLLLGADPRAGDAGALTATIVHAMAAAGAVVGVGRYDEPRALYTSELFGGAFDPRTERRTIHLGIDLFVPPGSEVRAPLDGVVHLLANNQAPLDYGPLVVLRHETDEGQEFFTLFGHLSEDTLGGLVVGQAVRRGERIGAVGAPPRNGGWTPHVHVQIILDLLGLDADFPGVAYASQRRVWTALSPDPNLLLGIPADRFPLAEPRHEETLARRRQSLAPSVRLSYRRPLKIVRGYLQHLYDETARAYLDVYNNVPLVGHSHPRVVRAAQQQLALLNTNTRYLHDNAVRYAERLTARLPEPLRVCFLVNSGSEANELALRLARTHTQRQDVIVLEHAYHGHTTTLIDVSPYKFLGPGGSGRKSWVHVAPLPDDYRGPFRRGDPQAGAQYAAAVAEIAARSRTSGDGPAAFLAETLPSVAGQIVFPPGYLADAYRHVRAAGGLCIADEVQTGFGRLGTHFWGFETQGVVPDIVVLGKPIANGFPLGAVVTTPEIARSFDNGMEFFSTFGGNPVACAAGLAVLDVLEDEGLQGQALRVGRHLLGGLRSLQEREPIIGDVRGSGLFLGVELVRDRPSREPATFEAHYVVNRLRECGILTGTDGPYENVLKLRPPLVFREEDADVFLAALETVLLDDAVRASSA